MLYFHPLEISRKFTIVACEQLHVVCIVDLYSVLWLFFVFFFITLYCEPELSLNRTVTVTANICFHHA